jgi:hypothetical protein
VFFEEVDVLGFAVFGDRELGLRKAGDRIAIFLVDDDVNEDLTDRSA